MAKTLKVHVLYGDKEAISTVISRMVEHDILINYSGEYLYSSTPWDYFIETHCQDIKDRLKPCVENWAERCLTGSYEGEESDTEFSVTVNGEQKFKAYTYPCYVEAFSHFLYVMGFTCAANGLNIDYHTAAKH